MKRKTRSSETEKKERADFLKKRPRPSRGSLCRRREATEPTIVVDLKACAYYTLNPTAGMIWQSLDGRKTVREIAKKAGRACGRGKEKAFGEILRHIKRLEELNLVACK